MQASRLTLTMACIACAAFSVWVSTVVLAGSYAVHDEVVAKQDGQLMVSGQKQIAAYHMGTTFTVQAVQDDWLWVTSGSSGWIRSQDVVKLDVHAVEQFTTLIDRDTGSAKYRNARASVWRGLGEYEKAIADHDAAIDICPSGWHYANRGRTWVADKEYDKAIADYNEAIRFCPEIARFYALRSVVWLEKNDDDRALADVNDAIRLDANLEIAYRVRSSIWLFQGNFEQAIRDCDEVLRLNPLNLGGLCNRARAWIGVGQLENAVADCETAIQLERSHAFSYSLRGLARYMNGDSQAIEDFQTSIDLSPEISPYDVILGYILSLREGDKLRAQLFIVRHANKLAGREYLPAIQYVRGDISEANLLTAIHSLPDSVESKAYKAELFCFIGLKQQAEGRAKQALMSYLICIGLSERGLLVRDIAIFELKQLLQR